MNFLGNVEWKLFSSFIIYSQQCFFLFFLNFEFFELISIIINNKYFFFFDFYHCTLFCCFRCSPTKHTCFLHRTSSDVFIIIFVHFFLLASHLLSIWTLIVFVCFFFPFFFCLSIVNVSTRIHWGRGLVLIYCEFHFYGAVSWIEKLIESTTMFCTSHSHFDLVTNILTLKRKFWQFFI